MNLPRFQSVGRPLTKKIGKDIRLPVGKQG